MKTAGKPYFQQRRERRGLLRGGLAVAALPLAGCDAISQSETGKDVLRLGERLSYGVQRLLGRRAMAQEFPAPDIAPKFKANGTLHPPGDKYAKLAAGNFAAWRLTVDGLVDKPLELSLAQLRAMPARTQITRHDCVEGWSCIGQWTGARLSAVLEAAAARPTAKYVVFHCMDRMDEDDEASLYYESVDMDDAMHEQTILAYDLNGAPVPVENGAPLRARIERQLGYKHAKYLHRIELVESFAGMRGGRGGYWEDEGYNWYAGI